MARGKRRGRRARAGRSSLRRVLLVLLGVVPLLGAGLFYGAFRLYLDRPVDASASAPVSVSIPRGAGFRGAVARLEAAGVVQQPTLFLLHAWLAGQTTALKAGTYRLDLRRTPRELLDELVRGQPEPYLVVTVREGDNVWEVAERIAAAGVASVGDVEARLRDPALAARLGVPPPGRPLPAWASPLEGYLFPETYFAATDATVDDVVGKMVAQHVLVVRRLLARHAATAEALRAAHGLSERDFVTLASLVEAEVRVREEAPVVAGVFYNRLQRRMKLQTDPTLVYHPDHRREKASPTRRKDATNPYNTYAHAGLPPGPIGNPGEVALGAALAPAVGDFLFFVARQDGSGRHHFSRTGEEHRAAVETYLLRAGTRRP